MGAHRIKADSSPIEPTLGTYGRFLRRHVILAVLGVLIGMTIAAVFVENSPLAYRSTATVVVSLLPATSADDELQVARRRNVSLDSDAQVVRSTRVLQAATEKVPFTGGYEELNRNLAITALPNSRVLELRVSSTRPDLSRNAALAVAETFLDVRRATIEQRAREELDVVEGQIEAVSARLAALRVQAAQSNARAMLGLEEGRLTQRLDELGHQLARQIADPVDAGFIAQSPSLAPRGTHANVSGWLVSGALCGLVIALALASAFDTRRTLPTAHLKRSWPFRRSRRTPHPSRSETHDRLPGLTS